MTFLVVLVSVQVVHDFLFYAFFSAVPKKYNYMLGLFKDYAAENGIKALIADSCMMVVACLLASQIKNLSTNKLLEMIRTLLN